MIHWHISIDLIEQAWCRHLIIISLAIFPFPCLSAQASGGV